MGGLFFFHRARQHQDVEEIAHPGGSGDVLELERDLGLLLRQPAIFEGVGELGVFADANQELRLRDQWKRSQT